MGHETPETEPTSAGSVRVEAPVRRGDYVLATKYHDGDPGDQWAIGFFAGRLPKFTGDRYMVADAEGKQFRGNGFRRVKRISAERGRWLLDHTQEIEHGSRSLWWWVRTKMSA